MKKQKVVKLKRYLEDIHREFVETNEIQKDAIAPALAYETQQDREFAAFICAVLAYGRVAHIQASTKKVLKPMGPRPVSWLLQSDAEDLQALTKGWSHRFNTASDMFLLLVLLKQVYREWGTLESFVEPCAQDTAASLLERLIDRLTSLDPSPLKRIPNRASSFWFLLPRPSSGSACKRLNLFLRWMVGVSEMDLSLWTKFSRSRLIVPVDTHLHRQAKKLGLTQRSAADWKTAEEITQNLKYLDPEDPTRFDFAICHIGIREGRPSASQQES